jgi:hypothetical protein
MSEDLASGQAFIDLALLSTRRQVLRSTPAAGGGREALRGVSRILPPAIGRVAHWMRLMDVAGPLVERRLEGSRLAIKVSMTS